MLSVFVDAASSATARWLTTERLTTEGQLESDLKSRVPVLVVELSPSRH